MLSIIIFIIRHQYAWCYQKVNKQTRKRIKRLSKTQMRVKHPACIETLVLYWELGIQIICTFTNVTLGLNSLSHPSCLVLYGERKEGARGLWKANRPRSIETC